MSDLVARFGGWVDDRRGKAGWWITDPDSVALDAATAAGLAVVRRVHQMRRSLPLDGPDATPLATPLATPTPTRAFDPERDVDAFLAVNNAAFAWHPDQSAWTRADLEERMGEPWFDLDGFRVADRADDPTGLAGFCWTKVHPAAPDDGEPDARGEIYVIAVAPDLAGHGFGAGLTAAGLDWLWTQRHTPIGMLYVEQENDRAVRTYERLGFAITSTDVLLAPDAPAQDATAQDATAEDAP